MAKTKPELPEDLMEEIRVRLEERIDDIKQYDIPQNSADHLMLVAQPVVRKVVVDVTFDDAVIDRIMPWLNSCEKTEGMHSRHSRVEELVYRFSVDMVRHYRPEFVPGTFRTFLSGNRA